MVIVDPIAPAGGEKELMVAKTELLLEGVFFLQEKNAKKERDTNKIETLMKIGLKIILLDTLKLIKKHHQIRIYSEIQVLIILSGNLTDNFLKV